ncbi:MAG: M48 family metallopeptidase [Thermotogae bacterium]|nr:M48 family metallopeptidase [Thermotogota bacterium]
MEYRDSELGVMWDIITAEVRIWAKRIGVEKRLRGVYIRPMRRKWASVSTEGDLFLSEELLSQPARFRHEVIVHELVHLKLMSGRHNKLFKHFVKAYLEKYGIKEGNDGRP